MDLILRGLERVFHCCSVCETPLNFNSVGNYIPYYMKLSQHINFANFAISKKNREN